MAWILNLYLLDWNSMVWFHIMMVWTLVQKHVNLRCCKVLQNASSQDRSSTQSVARAVSQIQPDKSCKSQSQNLINSLYCADVTFVWIGLVKLTLETWLVFSMLDVDQDSPDCLQLVVQKNVSQWGINAVVSEGRTFGMRASFVTSPDFPDFEFSSHAAGRLQHASCGAFLVLLKAYRSWRGAGGTWGTLRKALN